MDESLYKDAEVKGVVYHYFVSPPEGAMPTLLFCHGWPSTSFDWRFQVTFFIERGYGVIAPDMLGYGGTHAPTDLDEYRARNYCEQLVGLLDLEGIGKAVAVGHDWYVSEVLEGDFEKLMRGWNAQGQRRRLEPRQLVPGPLLGLRVHRNAVHPSGRIDDGHAAGGHQRANAILVRLRTAGILDVSLLRGRASCRSPGSPCTQVLLVRTRGSAHHGLLARLAVLPHL